VHTAWNPQEPWHGFVHLFRTQAKLVGQSALIAHSGRQFGGAPIMPDTHEQTGCPSRTWHSAFAPHGEGMQGLVA
jgi:hypothetical protein